MIVIIIIAYVISKKAAKKIVAPVNDMDLNNEETEEPYPCLLYTSFQKTGWDIQLNLVIWQEISALYQC